MPSSQFPHPVVRIGRLGGFVLVAVVLLLCAGGYWVSASGGVSGVRARITGESGRLTVQQCYSSRGGTQRATWSCVGTFAPDNGAARAIAFGSTTEIPAGERLTADVADGSTTDVHVRHSPAGALLLCPLALTAAVIVGGLRALRSRRYR